MAMSTPSYRVRSKEHCRLQAVMALFRGEQASHVSVTFRIARSALYKFRHRALTAMRQALADHRRGPKRPHNRLNPSQEAGVVAFCQRHPTLSSYHIRQQLGIDTPSPRTIQRVRKRHGMVRLPQRTPATRPARCLTPEAIQRAEAVISEKPHLGPERIAWDLQNGEHLTISPATIKRLKRKLHEAMCPPPPPPVWRFYERHHPHSLWHGDFLEKVTLTDLDRTAYQLTLMDDYSRGYVFCDLFLHPDMRTTIQALIAAMRQWRVIPKAVVFDNGSPFKGKLLSAFCEHVGIRLIHSAVNHPQTNGKLERAFRDDMRDFYQQYDKWLLELIRRDLPSYVYYRNYIRGHQALGGKPSSTRLEEHSRVAPPELLDRLESYACYEMGRKIIPATGSIRLFGRDAYVGAALASVEVTFFESLEGLEARINGQCMALLRDYRTFRQMSCYEWRHLPPVLYFEHYEPVGCPRIAVAQ
jgi:transposase InsO family protein